MAILFCGSRKCDFETAMLPTYTTTFFTAANQAEGLRADMESAYPIIIPLQAAATDKLWVHYRLFNNRNSASGLTSADGRQISFYDNNRRLVAYVQMTDGVTRAVANGDTVVTSTGSFTFAALGNPTYTMDISVLLDVSGITIDYYVDGTLIASATASNSGGSSKGWPSFIYLDHTDIQGSNGNSLGNGVSEVIVAQAESTVGLRLITLVPNATGNYAEWSGDYTALSARGDAISLGAFNPNKRESWNLSDFGGTAPSSIRGVFAQFMAIKGSAGPQSYNAFLRAGGVDYDATPQSPVTNQHQIFEWATNPAGGAWTISAINACELGVKSVA